MDLPSVCWLFCPVLMLTSFVLMCSGTLCWTLIWIVTCGFKLYGRMWNGIQFGSKLSYFLILQLSCLRLGLCWTFWEAACVEENHVFKFISLGFCVSVVDVFTCYPTPSLPDTYLWYSPGVIPHPVWQSVTLLLSTCYQLYAHLQINLIRFNINRLSNQLDIHSLGLFSVCKKAWKLITLDDTLLVFIIRSK